MPRLPELRSALRWRILAGSSARSRARRRTLGVLCVALCMGDAASAQPVLHEYIDLGPGPEPLPPVPTRHGDPPGNGSDPTPGNAGGTGPGAAGDPDPGLRPGAPFSIDRDTTRPSRVSYDDPFTPTVVPFKRLVVYDAVSPDGALLLESERHALVPAAGPARPNDEHFYAALHLSLQAGQDLPIPSVAPGARLVVAHANPAAKLRLLVDSAENWFLRADRAGEFDVSLQVVADRRVFGSPFRDANWSDLSHALPSLPPSVKSAALDVAHTLGIADGVRPREAVSHLVEHFRRFRSSSKHPSSYGLGLYRELALTARGICRHRAYAFMLTALGLGIPTRMVMNEAHAWVEVFDGELWHRIDLGGAAEQLDSADAGRPHHVEPRDPFVWPDASESGRALAERSLERRASARDAAGTTAGAAAGAAPGAPSATGAGGAAAAPGGVNVEPSAGTEPGTLAAALDPDPGTTDGAQGAATAPSAPLAKVALVTGAGAAERGRPLFVSGRVSDGRRICSGISVELSLAGTNAPPIALGTLVSDGHGEFSGSLIVPYEAALGDHSLLARATSGCALDAPAR